MMSAETKEPQPLAAALHSNDREILLDKRFIESPPKGSLITNKLFTRLVAKDIVFTKVDFKYTIFDACYLRNCKFDDCDFTGCRFINCNFHGSSFLGSKFDYSYFEKTLIDSDILESNAPSVENLKERFARTLRTNYQSLGDSRSANKAIVFELEATGEHLRKSWKSNESYYRKKYSGINRIRQFFFWLGFRILDFIWGNGESLGKLARFILITFGLMTIYEVFLHQDSNQLVSYWNTLLAAPAVFFGTTKFEGYPEWYFSFVAIIRLILIGLFVSIIVKRYNRR